MYAALRCLDVLRLQVEHRRLDTERASHRKAHASAGEF
jgi:hypothetical protein